MAREPRRLVRGNSEKVAAHIDLSGEPAVNTDTGALHIQDGVNPGGVRHLTEADRTEILGQVTASNKLPRTYLSGLTLAVDVIASANPTSPTLSSGYTRKRYIGSVIRAVGSNYTFTQIGDYFRKRAIGADVNVPDLLVARHLITLPVLPVGGPVQVDLNVRLVNASASSIVYLSNPDDLDMPPSFAGNPFGSLGSGVANSSIVSQVSVWTNASRQITARANVAGLTLMAGIIGWRDPRILNPS
jgi:hypothetical protein